MPFTKDTPTRYKPGQSGNPSGKPKTDPTVKQLLKAATPDAARKIVELLNCGNPKIEFQAAQEILNRTQGKPREQVAMEISSDSDMKLQVRSVLLERLRVNFDGEKKEITGGDAITVEAIEHRGQDTASAISAERTDTATSAIGAISSVA